MRRRRQLFIRAHPRPPVCVCVRTCARVCACVRVCACARVRIRVRMRSFHRWDRKAREPPRECSAGRLRSREAGLVAKRVPLLLSPIVPLSFPYSPFTVPLPSPSFPCLLLLPFPFALRLRASPCVLFASRLSCSSRACPLSAQVALSNFFARAFTLFCAPYVGAVFFLLFLLKFCVFLPMIGT